MKKVSLLFLVLSVVGCAGIPLSSVYKMMTANPLEFHPDGVSIAIKRPNIIQVNTGDIKMSISINSENPELSVSQQYFFVVDNTPYIPLKLMERLRGNDELTILKLSPEDVIRMKNLQKRMKSHLKNGGVSKDFGFSVRVLRGCKNSNDIPKNVLLSLFLKLDLQSDFFALYEDYNIGQADLSPLKNLNDWDNCTNKFGTPN